VRVLVTGHRGYLGSVMAPRLAAAGHDVVGMDVGMFDDCTLVPDEGQISSVRRDIRDVTAEDFSGFDAVVHLAALSNDPIGNLNDAWTEDINFHASIKVAELAKAASVPRFLFSSSCIMYGMSEAAVVSEEAPLDPKTEYARSKVKAERAIADIAGDGFSPTFLRNGTVYGLSPRMRFDTVLNDLVGSAVTRGKVIVQGDGSPWRPVIHIEDVAAAFQAVLGAPLEDVHNQAFNTGSDDLNHQVRELAEQAVAAVPGAELEVLGRAEADQRTYKADFGKFRRTFPDFEWRWSPTTGARDLAERLIDAGVTREDFEGRRFVRLKWLQHLLEKGQLDQQLRWADR
jgi:nucleoside-diphosphate-sugar epimerase